MRAILFWAALLAAQDLTELSRMGKQAMAERRYADAAAIYEKMTAAMPDNAGLRLNMGLALFSSGDFSGSVAALEKCTRLDPKMQKAWLLLGFSYQKQHQPDRAIPPLRSALDLDPADTLARFNWPTPISRRGRRSWPATNSSCWLSRIPGTPKRCWVWESLIWNSTPMRCGPGS